MSTIIAAEPADNAASGVPLFLRRSLERRSRFRIGNNATRRVQAYLSAWH
ncbi:hypothetical protein [Rhizobium lentis]|uniref:Uncharacterized protein n=1 Tax=Rhizobium lentis TaxID=1138194 RepID=A0A7W8XHU1_9HYPH|nr:hypothetical protein [Rhizobium lentis]MBB4576557.1 hypothetical protein [Rhizobium lentis]MBB5552578.1 hypothetical protein [Rhizobium lentis]MBB5563117.1 hypothetical protein [Rhizobium lentis]MBB5569395.1 hypothetical protein [Rhizobium lentis]